MPWVCMTVRQERQQSRGGTTGTKRETAERRETLRKVGKI